MRSILLLPLVARCLETIDICILALWCGPRIASLLLPRYVVRGD